MDNLFILLDEHAAVAESGVQAIGELIALNIVFLAEFAALDELENPRKTTAVLCTSEDQAIVVDAVVALKTWVSETLLLFAEDEPGAEKCLQAEVVVCLETSVKAAEYIVAPLLASGDDFVRWCCLSPWLLGDDRLLLLVFGHCDIIIRL